MGTIRDENVTNTFDGLPCIPRTVPWASAENIREPELRGHLANTTVDSYSNCLDILNTASQQEHSISRRSDGSIDYKTTKESMRKSINKSQFPNLFFINNESILERFSSFDDLLHYIEASFEPRYAGMETSTLLKKLLPIPIPVLEHYLTLGDYFRHLYEEDQLMDVCVSVQGQQFMAHRIVLCCFSEYFMDYFRKSTEAMVLIDISLKEISAEAFASFLEFIYTGELSICPETAADLLKTADMLGVPALQQYTQTILQKFTIEDIVKSVVREGQRSSSWMITKVVDNFDRASKIPDFLRIDPQTLRMFLESDNLHVHSELEAFEIAVRWIMHNTDIRVKEAAIILQQIRFGHMTYDELLDCVDHVNFLVENPTIRSLILQACWQIMLRLTRRSDPLHLDFPPPRSYSQGHMTNHVTPIYPPPRATTGTTKPNGKSAEVTYNSSCETSQRPVNHNVNDEMSQRPVNRNVTDETSQRTVNHNVNDETSQRTVNRNVNDETSQRTVNHNVNDETSQRTFNHNVNDENIQRTVNHNVPDEMSQRTVNRNVTDEMSQRTVNRNVTDETSHRPVNHNVTDEMSQRPVNHNVTDEMSQRTVNRNVTDEMSQRTVNHNVTDEMSQRPVNHNVTDEMSQRPVNHNVTDKMSQRTVNRNVTDEMSQRTVNRNVTDEMSHRTVNHNVTDEMSQRTVNRNVTDEMSQRTVNRNVTDETSQRPVNHNVTDEMPQRTVNRNVNDEMSQRTVNRNVTDETSQRTVNHNVNDETSQRTVNRNVNDETSQRPVNRNVTGETSHRPVAYNMTDMTSQKQVNAAVKSNNYGKPVMLSPKYQSLAYLKRPIKHNSMVVKCNSDGETSHKPPKYSISCETAKRLINYNNAGETSQKPVKHNITDETTKRQIQYNNTGDKSHKPELHNITSETAQRLIQYNNTGERSEYPIEHNTANTTVQKPVIHSITCESAQRLINYNNTGERSECPIEHNAANTTVQKPVIHSITCESSQRLINYNNTGERSQKPVIHSITGESAQRLIHYNNTGERSECPLEHNTANTTVQKPVIHSNNCESAQRLINYNTGERSQKPVIHNISCESAQRLINYNNTGERSQKPVIHSITGETAQRLKNYNITSETSQETVKQKIPDEMSQKPVNSDVQYVNYGSPIMLSPKHRSIASPPSFKVNIYLFGGYNLQETSVLEQPSQSSPSPWRSSCRLPVWRRHHAVAALLGHVYLTGGYDPESSDFYHPEPTGTAHRMDLKTKQWEVLPEMNEPRLLHSACSASGKIYVFGGIGIYDTVLNSVECFHPRTNQWTMIVSMPTGRYGSAAAVVGCSIYVVGGIGDGSGMHVLDTVESFDTANKSWNVGVPLPGPRCHVGLVSFAGSLFVIGGAKSATGITLESMTSVDEYLHGTEEWKHVADMATARHSFGVTSAGHRIYMIGGLNISRGTEVLLQSVECFDTCSGTWISGTKQLPVPVRSFACVSDIASY